MKYWQRIQTAINHAGGNKAAIAKKIKTMPDGQKFEGNYLTQIIDRHNENSKYTHLIAEACGVDRDWLATGQGEMISENYAHQAYDAAFLLQEVCDEKGLYIATDQKYDIVESLVQDARDMKSQISKSVVERRVTLVANKKS